MSNDAISTVRMAAFTPSTGKAASPTKAAVAMPSSGDPSVATEMPPTEEVVRASARQIESYLKRSGRELEFRFDDASGQMVVSVRDASTGDLIRQIPGEEVLRMARMLKESSPSLIDLKT